MSLDIWITTWTNKFNYHKEQESCTGAWGGWGVCRPYPSFWGREAIFDRPSDQENCFPENGLKEMQE